MSPKILLYVQHLLGTGHYVRTLAIATRLLEQGCDVHFVSGGMPLPSIFLDPALSFLQLPPCRSEDATFKTLVDGDGNPITDGWKVERRNLLYAYFHKIKPDAFVTELYPFGRRAFRDEILPILKDIQQKSLPTRVICSVRDILTSNKSPSRMEETVELINTYYDLVLVHGDESFVEFKETFLYASAINDKLLYTGYVTDPKRYEETVSTKEDIVVSAGGGSVGERLCRIALEAAICTSKSRKWRIITGSNFSDETYKKLQTHCPQSVTLERFVPNLPSLLKSCNVSISQAGYNTVAELLQNRTKAILVPFSAGTETEQTLRAQKMEKAGVALHLPPHKLTAQSLVEALNNSERLKYPKKFSLDLNGSYRSARLIKSEAEIAGYQKVAS